MQIYVCKPRFLVYEISDAIHSNSAANIHLLISILSSPSEPPSVRSNIIISIGDLCFRFPNLVEPYTDYIYKTLRDKDIRVRKNALLVLTHLILHDMIKVNSS